MARPLEVSEDVVVRADVERVWAAVSDPTQTRRWSPENTGATASGPLGVGDTFEGRNRRFGVPWSTRCVVTVREEGRRFAFRVEAIGARSPRLRARIATWEYRLEPVAGGTRVTETWTDDRRWPDLGAAVVDRVLTRGSTFAAHNRSNIRTTLDGLARELGGAP